MEQRNFLLAIGFCLIALCVLAVGVYLLMSTRTAPSQYVNLPTGGTSTTTGSAVDASSYLKVTTPAGEVLVRDPREWDGVVAMGDGLFALTSLENVNNTSFGLVFNEADASFAIGLEAEPLGETRRQAEQYVLSLLGIPEDQLCQLNVYVGTTARINQFYAGKNLGLSFCDGSVQLP